MERVVMTAALVEEFIGTTLALRQETEVLRAGKEGEAGIGFRRLGSEIPRQAIIGLPLKPNAPDARSGAFAGRS